MQRTQQCCIKGRIIKGIPGHVLRVNQIMQRTQQCSIKGRINKGIPGRFIRVTLYNAMYLKVLHEW